ncbi:alanine dehydrogenase [Marinococcus halophilus]|uniref:Alanine dehydrogenase n=1 Tax=Marinococcus halophilus TaxID=1371 RepID=A0A510Y988_MARHA|nr:alanine dehydrogenase [Marinococcus halophilus]OZT79098.1 alanine dehydrogenase [Marinococcus halophilus]GEK59919.1 alanine dehydrogenase [Marinococcus halophilus]
MIIGVPKEVKQGENRVALSPTSVAVLTKKGFDVLLESGAGEGSGFIDREYEGAGASLSTRAAEVWNQADMIVKVKEPQPAEYDYFRPGLVLFTYLHLAAEPALAKALMENHVTAFAYETIEENGTLPLLTPMSEVAGKMAAQIGAHLLEKHQRGQGVLLGGVPGVAKSNVTIIGGGVAGTNAARIAVGLGAEVTILDLNANRLRELDELFDGRVKTVMSNPLTIAESVKEASLVIGAVLVPGAKTPKLVTEEMIQSMKDGAVVLDVAIDQGGVFETVDRITTHGDPVYIKHGVLHYAVANIPGAVPRTSTMALNNVTLPYIAALAAKHETHTYLDDPQLRQGLNTYRGNITNKEVAQALNLKYELA